MRRSASVPLVPRGCWALLIAALFLQFPVDAAEPLTTALQVRSLSAERAAEEIPVDLRAIVTFIDEGQTVFIQDSTSGTFFQIRTPHAPLAVGDLVHLSGTTFPGLFIPGVRNAHFEVLDRQPLPAPRPAALDDLASGRFHYQRVQVKGRVHQIDSVSESESQLQLAIGPRTLTVQIDAPLADPSIWLDAEVDAIGLAAGEINDRRQIVAPYLRLADWQSLTLTQPATQPDQLPTATATSLLTAAAMDPASGPQRVRVMGVILGSLSADAFSLRDAEPPETGASAVEIQFRQPVELAPGDLVEVAGYPTMLTYSAGLSSAELLASTPGSVPLPIPTTLRSLSRGDLDGEKIVIEGQLEQIFVSRKGHEWLISDGGETLSVTVRHPGSTPTPDIGSRLRLTGLLRIESARGEGFNARPDSLRLVVASKDDWQLLRPPPWWTPRRLVTALITLAGAAIATLLWVGSLRRQVRKQALALKDRITREATLEERQRIAREFHDTLEQELAGLTIRLDAAESRPLEPKAASLIQTCRHLVARIQFEARKFVSDLREESTTTLDLCTALNDLVQRQSDGPPILIWQPPAGPPQLPGATAHHLYMMAQEAVTNAQKHAQAQTVTLRIEASDDSLRLTVTDDGIGLPGTSPPSTPGHFGCMGIRERARKIGANVSWTPQTDGGTEFIVDCPLTQ